MGTKQPVIELRLVGEDHEPCHLSWYLLREKDKTAYHAGWYTRDGRWTCELKVFPGCIGELIPVAMIVEKTLEL